MTVELEKHRNPGTKWHIEIMAGAIVALKEAGMPVNAVYLQVHHSSLYQGIRNHPGGWRNVIFVAGLEPKEETKANNIKQRRLHGA